ncbi:GTPase [Demequina mangrovi]|uniref:50S ribosome-binding GTPase n=1 Tax=Demequina mangrovi TaxID=1043493 RepID=A0A1H7ATI3_9MICO|nr:GTPase [Demequina mangrovi]SEJ68266.1 50S ribosome-binding GTPase [Demequina mangrovi]
MSVSFEEVSPKDETAVLHERVERLRSSLEWASEAIPAPIRTELHAAVDRCDERLELGIDWTVVALAGGTGSGKSTLFNALTGVEFAISGVARPTTSHVSAAVWGHERADALLDWLGVEPGSRLRRDDAPLSEDPELTGLILLDLPDHDSVNAHNREVVDRILPRVDLLLWVVDPQKYADNAIHEGYLREASATGQPSLVALNHVDRLSTQDAWEVARDLQRLLAEDGMLSVPVMPVSARTGQGVDVLRAEIEGAVQARSVAADAVAADLVDAGRTLERALARDADPELPDVAELVASLAKAAGVDARAEAAAAVVAGKASSVPVQERMRLEVVDRERLDWVDAASEGLPVQWRVVIDEAIDPADALTREIDIALAAVEWPVADHAPLFRRRARGSVIRKEMLRLGREAVLSAIEPHVVQPTDAIHQAYRNLDELTVIARASAPEQPAHDEEPVQAPAEAVAPVEEEPLPADIWAPVMRDRDEHHRD